METNMANYRLERRRAMALGAEILAAVRKEQASETESFPAEDPSTRQHLWDLPEAGETAVDRLVARARAAQPEWARLPTEAKARAFIAIAETIEANTTAIAELLALESGKAYTTECLSEVTLMANIFRYFSGAGHEIKGRSQLLSPRLFTFTSHHPHGVIAGIVPWNVPLMLMAYKVAAPLMAGNTVVLKLPEQTSLTLAHVHRLIAPHLPNDVCLVAIGTGAITGEALVTHSDVDKVSFTGSVETGRHIGVAAARAIRPATLELGGKSPMIVLQDCPIDKAVTGVLNSMRFTRAGQSCTASTRIYVPKSRLSDYREALGAALDNLLVGDALDPATSCGPVVNQRQHARITEYLNGAKARGLDLVSHGRLMEGVALDDGYFVMPHLIFDPDPEDPVSREEIFGPVATVSGYDDLDGALALANTSTFGLSASVWGQNIAECLSLANAFHVGIVQINQNAVMLPGLSYGGVKNSGIGKESSREAMIESYMYEKTNIVNYD